MKKFLKFHTTMNQHPKSGMNTRSDKYRGISVFHVMCVLVPLCAYIAWIATGITANVIVQYNHEFFKAQERKIDGTEYSSYKHCTDPELRRRYEKHEMYDCNRAEDYSRINPSLEARRMVWEHSYPYRLYLSVCRNLEYSIYYIRFILLLIVACSVLLIYQWFSAFSGFYWAKSMHETLDKIREFQSPPIHHNNRYPHLERIHSPHRRYYSEGDLDQCKKVRIKREIMEEVDDHDEGDDSD